MKRLFFGLALFGLALIPFGTLDPPARAQETPKAAPAKAFPANHPRGRRITPPAVVHQRQAYTKAKFVSSLAWMHHLIPANYDARTVGQVPKDGDQDGCGNCYIWSGCRVCAVGQLVAGVVKAPFGLSVQCMLDCQRQLGGCSGGDEWEVAQLIMAKGCPSDTDYPGLGQSPGNCKSTAGMTLYKIAGMGYCTPSAGTNGMANIADVQAHILKWGPVSIAVAADSSWDNYQAGQVLTAKTGPMDVNHAIIAIGWRTNADGTIDELCLNSWGPEWGDKGTCWIRIGCCSVNTEAFFVTVTMPTPPDPPNPPVPPTPPSTSATVTLNGTGTTLDGIAYEMLPPGTRSAIADMADAAAKLSALVNPAPVNPCDQQFRLLKARIDAMQTTEPPTNELLRRIDEQNRTMARMLDEMRLLQEKK